MGTEGEDERAADGRHDFDFLHGRWQIANRRLADPLAPDSEWQEFAASAVVRPLLGDLGNCDEYSAPAFPGRPGYEGFALRLFDPTADVWRIWWASTHGAGLLDAPLVGRFRDGRGRFEGDDVVSGREVRIRFDWTVRDAEAARWQQSFSLDGETYAPNWVMDFTRSR